MENSQGPWHYFVTSRHRLRSRHPRLRYVYLEIEAVWCMDQHGAGSIALFRMRTFSQRVKSTSWSQNLARTYKGDRKFPCQILIFLRPYTRIRNSTSIVKRISSDTLRTVV